MELVYTTYSFAFGDVTVNKEESIFFKNNIFNENHFGVYKNINNS